MIDRYSRPEMKALWSEEHRFRTWLEVELLAAEAWARLGKVPQSAVEAMRRRARVDVARIREIEATVRHDVIAFTTQVAETVGPEARYLHYGLTSSDVVDTAFSVLLCQAMDRILSGVDRVLALLRDRALRHRGLLMIGRTHGVHAEPTTLALKFALWYQEMLRNRERLERAREAVAVGKISGPVGTFSSVPPEVEAYVCERLGLRPAPVSTQILQRDRHAEYLSSLAILASSLDKFATEIRSLQRTEIRELEEPFREGQKGSSAMPHKRNPVTCEQISGLARVVRSNLQAALEDIPLWHERDISHSSVERIIFPDSTILADYLLHTFAEVLEGLRVYPENMRRNLARTRGLVFSGRVLLRLVEEGLSREAAYAVVQRAAMRSWEQEREFVDCLLEEPEIAGRFAREQLRDWMDPRAYVAREDEILRRAGILREEG